jgi:hypothetical protein
MAVPGAGVGLQRCKTEDRLIERSAGDGQLRSVTFDPAEYLLDALAAALADRIAGMAGGPPVDRASAGPAEKAATLWHQDAESGVLPLGQIPSDRTGEITLIFGSSNLCTRRASQRSEDRAQ